MKYCEKCHVTVEASEEYCPLCQDLLEPIDTPQTIQNTFPRIPTVYRKYNVFFKLLMLASVIGTILSIFLNVWLAHRITWSLFVLLGNICGWFLLVTVIRRNNNIPKTITKQVILVILFSLLFDYLTGWHAWSITYVLPSVCVFAMVTMAIIAKVMNLEIEDYMLYVLIDSCFGIVPILFLFTGWLTVTYPSLICVIGCIISLSSLFVFEGKNIIGELKRRFHL